MTEAHTPGPWAIDAGFLVQCHGSLKTPLLQFEGRASEEGEAFGWVTGDKAEHRANERLIAAAPELLAALILVTQRCGPNSSDGAIARAAIAKARGEVA